MPPIHKLPLLRVRGGSHDLPTPLPSRVIAGGHGRVALPPPRIYRGGRDRVALPLLRVYGGGRSRPTCPPPRIYGGGYGRVSGSPSCEQPCPCALRALLRDAADGRRQRAPTSFAGRSASRVSAPAPNPANKREQRQKMRRGGNPGRLLARSLIRSPGGNRCSGRNRGRRRRAHGRGSLGARERSRGRGAEGRSSRGALERSRFWGAGHRSSPGARECSRAPVARERSAARKEKEKGKHDIECFGRTHHIFPEGRQKR